MNQKKIIYGIFFKQEIHKDKLYYHFIIPELYHNIPINKSKKLLEYDNTCSLKIEENNSKLYSPIYKDKNLIKFSCTSHSKLNLIVGLEYKLVVYFNNYKFKAIEGGDIIGWKIHIISTTEDGSNFI